MEDNEKNIDLVDVKDACPTCGERHCDELVWINEATNVECQSCKTVYVPPKPESLMNLTQPQ